MVKNTHGGSGHKKFGRKFTASSSKSNKLRVSEDEGEIYAIVTKLLGNNMFHCFCIDGIIRLGHIRGKFTGRGKRDNMVEGGKWVLIGLREWDNSDASGSKAKVKMQQCDLLEVYTDSDKMRLRDSEMEDWIQLDMNDVSKISKDSECSYDEFAFATDKDIERQKLIDEMKSATAEKITMKLGEKVDEDVVEEEVNFDDI